MFLLFHICSTDQTATYCFSIHYILDFFRLYHKFMDNLGKLELQVANWLIYLIYTYYLYLHKYSTKSLWEINSATLKVQGRNCVR